MGIDGYADRTRSVPGWGDGWASRIRNDRTGAFAYEYEDGDSSRIAVVTNSGVEYEVPYNGGAWDMGVGRDGERWVVNMGDHSNDGLWPLSHMYRGSSKSVEGETWTMSDDWGIYPPACAVSRSPSSYHRSGYEQNAILPAVSDSGRGEWRAYAPHDFPFPENYPPDELDYYSLDPDSDWTDGRLVRGAGADDDRYLVAVDVGDELRLYSIRDRYNDIDPETTNAESRYAYLRYNDRTQITDYPSELEIQDMCITPVYDAGTHFSSDEWVVAMVAQDRAYAIDSSGITRLADLPEQLGIGLDPEGRYVATYGPGRGLVYDRFDDYALVLDTDFRPEMDAVRGMQWNHETRELVIIWDSDSDEQRYASFLSPPFRQTFDDANRSLREMVNVTCIVPEGEFSSGNTVEIAAEFENESFEAVRAEASWSVGGAELSADGIIDARGTGRISDQLAVVGDVETAAGGTELDVEMEWSVSRRGGD